MTEDRMALVELIEQGADSDLVREMLAFAAERMMDMEIEAKTGVLCGSRSPEPLNHRNGYRERGWVPELAGSNWRSRNCARAATFRAFSSRAAPRRRPWRQ